MQEELENMKYAEAVARLEHLAGQIAAAAGAPGFDARGFVQKWLMTEVEGMWPCDLLEEPLCRGVAAGLLVRTLRCEFNYTGVV